MCVCVSFYANKVYVKVTTTHTHGDVKCVKDLEVTYNHNEWWGLWRKGYTIYITVSLMWCMYKSIGGGASYLALTSRRGLREKNYSAVVDRTNALSVARKHSSLYKLEVT